MFVNNRALHEAREKTKKYQKIKIVSLKVNSQDGIGALWRLEEGAGDGAEEGQVHRRQGEWRRQDVLRRQVGGQGHLRRAADADRRRRREQQHAAREALISLVTF